MGLPELILPTRCLNYPLYIIHVLVVQKPKITILAYNKLMACMNFCIHTAQSAERCHTFKVERYRGWGTMPLSIAIFRFKMYLHLIWWEWGKPCMFSHVPIQVRLSDLLMSIVTPIAHKTNIVRNKRNVLCQSRFFYYQIYSILKNLPFLLISKWMLIVYLLVSS